MLYLKQFVIGSCALVFLPLYMGYYKLKRKENSFYKYTIITPLWFGLWNVLSLIVAKQFNLNMRTRFLLVSILSYLSTLTYVVNNNIYDFTETDWHYYYVLLLFTYLFIWNIVIYNLEIMI